MTGTVAAPAFTTMQQTLQAQQTTILPTKDEEEALRIRDAAPIGRFYSDIEETEVEWLIPRFFPFKPCLLSGKAGSKKSWIS